VKVERIINDVGQPAIEVDTSGPDMLIVLSVGLRYSALKVGAGFSGNVISQCVSPSPAHAIAVAFGLSADSNDARRI
jgi:hypothetical protein